MAEFIKLPVVFGRGGRRIYGTKCSNWNTGFFYNYREQIFLYR